MRPAIPFTPCGRPRADLGVSGRSILSMKFLVTKGTTQTTCLRLMGKKMLVALMMEGKFSGEGIHSLEGDDDIDERDGP